MMFSTATLLSFLLVLSRVLAIFVFVPLPGMRVAPDIPKIVASVFISLTLYPFWPPVDPNMATMGRIALWMFGEMAFGALIGIVVAVASEAFGLAAQVIATQAGFSYAAVIDPNTQADNGVIVVMFQLLSGFLFFVSGVDHLVIRALAGSLQSLPPGTTINAASSLALVQHAGTLMFSTAVRLSLPVITLLLLIDISIALLTRIAVQLQLLSVAFPAKMLAAFAAIAILAGTAPMVFQSTVLAAFRDLGRRLIAGP